MFSTAYHGTESIELYRCTAAAILKKYYLKLSLRQVDSVQNSQRLFILQECEQGVLSVLFLKESVLGSILRNLDFNQVFEAAIPLDVKNLLCR